MPIPTAMPDPAEPASAGVQSLQYLTFVLSDQEYGVEILRVQEIRGWSRVTPLPHTEPHVLGVLNLRGNVVPVIDLRVRFGITHPEYGSTTVIVVVKVEVDDRSRTVGLVVDGVSEVYTVSAEEIRPAPGVGDADHRSFVKELFMLQEQMVIVLDIDALLADDIAATASTHTGN